MEPLSEEAPKLTGSTDPYSRLLNSYRSLTLLRGRYASRHSRTSATFSALEEQTQQVLDLQNRLLDQEEVRSKAWCEKKLLGRVII